MTTTGCQLDEHDFSHLFCINESCELFQQKGRGNIKLMGHQGRDKRTHQVYCTLCDKSMSENHGTVYFRSPIPRDEVRKMIRCLFEGNGVRGTARITGHDKDTVCRLVARAGEQAKAVMDELLREMELTEIQMDEFWTFVKKTEEPDRRGTGRGGVRRRLDPHRHRRGVEAVAGVEERATN